MNKQTYSVTEIGCCDQNKSLRNTVTSSRVILSFCQKASGKKSKPFVDSYFLNTSRDKPILGYLRLYRGQIIHKWNFKPGQISSENLCSSFLKLFSSQFFFHKRGTKNEKFERKEDKRSQNSEKGRRRSKKLGRSQINDLTWPTVILTLWMCLNWMSLKLNGTLFTRAGVFVCQVFLKKFR